MNKFRIGLILLIIGVAMLLVGGFTYTTQERTRLGPVSIEHPEEHTVPYMPVAGVILSLTGGALMLTGRSRNH